MRKLLLLQAGMLFAVIIAVAQPMAGTSTSGGAQPLPPYRPDRAEILDRYKKARYLDSIATRSIFKTAVRPHWAADNGSFWYRNILKDSVMEYISVDVAHGIRRKLDQKPADTITRNTAFSRLGSRRWASFSTDSLSPDKQWVAYVSEGNVFVRPASGGRGSGAPLTTDGDTSKPYGQLAWSPQ